MLSDKLDWVLLGLYAIASITAIIFQSWPLLFVIAAFAVVTFIQRYIQESAISSVMKKMDERNAKHIDILEKKMDFLLNKIESIQKELIKGIYTVENRSQLRDTSEKLEHTDIAEKIIQLENKLNKIKAFLED